VIEKVLSSKWPHMNEDMALRKTLTVKNANEQRHYGTRAIDVNLKWENQ
jgi:hypothetical protein